MRQIIFRFDGDLGEQTRFPDQAGIDGRGGWPLADPEAAHRAWRRHVAARRSGTVPKRPIADILTGAFASNRRRLITRNARDFRRNFPNLQIPEPC